jgi:hypothetical protein
MYGLSVGLSEISNISLIERSMREIGPGMRTNGYGGIGGALKGHFQSNSLGKKLLFVQAASSPTIKIERIDRKDIYMSFRDAETTRAVFSELSQWKN